MSGPAATADRLLVDGDVLVDHAVYAEAGDGDVSDGGAVEGGDLVDGGDSVVEVGDESAGGVVVDELAHGSPVEGDDRGAAGHGFDDAEAEGLVEVDEVQQGASASEEVGSVVGADRPEGATWVSK